MRRCAKPAKKIVSKGQYVRVQLKRAVTLMTGCTALLFAGIWALIVSLNCLADIYSSQHLHINLFSLIVSLALGTVIVGGGILVLGAIGVTLVKHSADMNDVVPFTKATVSNLPTPGSLVRASAEPSVAPETILLRATVDNATTPPEQLIRSSTSPE